MKFLRAWEQSIRRARKRMFPEWHATSRQFTLRFARLTDIFRGIERAIRNARKRVFARLPAGQRDVSIPFDQGTNKVGRPLSPGASQILAALSSVDECNKAA